MRPSARAVMVCLHPGEDYLKRQWRFALAAFRTDTLVKQLGQARVRGQASKSSPQCLRDGAPALTRCLGNRSGPSMWPVAGTLEVRLGPDNNLLHRQRRLAQPPSLAVLFACHRESSPLGGRKVRPILPPFVSINEKNPNTWQDEPILANEERNYGPRTRVASAGFLLRWW
jgi:hypothetical protein